MGRTWTPEQKKAHSKLMLSLWLRERIRKQSGLAAVTKLKVSKQLKIVLI